MMRKTKFEKYYIRGGDVNMVLAFRRDINTNMVLIGGSKSFKLNMEEIMGMFGWNEERLEWVERGWRIRLKPVIIHEESWQKGMRQLRRFYTLETTDSFRRMLR